MCDRRLRDLKKSLALLAKPFGAVVKIQITKGCHFRAVFSTDSWTLSIILASSRSDWRAMRNAEAFVRRELRRRAAA